MHCRCFSFFLGVCFALADGPAFGDEEKMVNAVDTIDAAVDRPSLTLEQVVHNALANNRELAAARVRIEQANARLVQAGLWPNPELELDGRFDNAFSNESEHTYAATINQPFSVSGRVGAQKEVAQVYIERTLAEVRDQERRTAAAVRTEFAEGLAAKEQAKLQAVLVGLDDGLLEATRMALARGQASEKALDSILIARQQAAQRLMRFETQAHSRLLRLNTLMGQPPQYEFSMAGELTIVSPPDLSAFTLEKALQRRPDYAAAQLDVVLARSEQGLTKARRVEDWRIGVGYESDQSVVDGAPPQPTEQFLSLKVTVPLPLFDRQQGRIRETLAMEDRAQKTVEALHMQIGQELADALNRVRGLATLLESYQGDLLKRAESNVKAVEEGYREGVTSMADVVQSRRQFNELTSSYIDALRDYRLALIDLDVAAGVVEESTP